MNYEKKYNEALDRAKMEMSKDGMKNDVIAIHLAETIFPELKKDENEMIKEELIKHLKEGAEGYEPAGSNSDYKRWLTWFEKQDELVNSLSKGLDNAHERIDKLIQKNNELCVKLEKQSEKKHKFNIGDIISDGQAVFRVDNITKNCIGQDCYFLVNVESEKKGIRYLQLTDSQGNRHNFGEITWLCEQVDAKFEKQDKQKSVDTVKPKFEIGDWVINRTNAIIMQIINNKDFYESVEINGQRRTDSYDYADWDFRLWTIQDVNDGDVLVGSYGTFIFMSKSYGYCGILSDNTFIRSTGNNEWTEDLHPATKEQRDLLFKKMKEAGYEWDGEKKELKKFHVIDEGKPEMDYCFTKMMNDEKVSSAWSEEDTFKVQRICKYLDEGKKYYADITEVRECMNWLKSIKERLGGK